MQMNRQMKMLEIMVMATALFMSLYACACSGAETKWLDDGYDENLDQLTFNADAWNYDEENDVYWQIGVKYCAAPATEEYETMGIYVPGAYLTGTMNSNGTYTCIVNNKGAVGNYTATTAPIVMPVNTAGYSAQAAPASYSYGGLSSYLDAGLIYLYAGCRGRSNGYDNSGVLIYSGGAPWGVVDLKAAIRYYRFNSEDLPGDTDRIFTFGHSGGGAQSSLVGVTGDSMLYTPYLESIGAAMYDRDGNYISDAICGAMCWCPITSLDYADEAYEWNMGQFVTTGTRAPDTFTAKLSKDLARSYAEYINALGIKSDDGTVLSLDESEVGIYTAGSYYEYMCGIVERSLNNFLNDTVFPYTESNGMMMPDGGFAGGGAIGGMTGGRLSNLPGGQGIQGPRPNASESPENSTTYETVTDYIASLNENKQWIIYDEKTNTAKITDMAAFVNHCKTPRKDVCAFDDLNRSQAENFVFGNDEYDALHFDAVLAALLEQNADTYAACVDWNGTYPTIYAEDLTRLDSLGSTIAERMDMYNPMYYISSYYDGYGTSTVAPHWRIHTGIEQGDTALTVETNLALELKQYDGVEDVDFTTVWGQGHTKAERTGDSTDNFIEWIRICSE